MKKKENLAKEIEEIEKAIKEIEDLLGETPFTKEMKEKVKQAKRRKIKQDKPIETKELDI